MANEEHLAALRNAIEKLDIRIWNKWIRKTLKVEYQARTDPSFGDTRGAELAGAHLGGMHLEGAQLERADLFEAHLEGAHLEGAHLEGANLDSAHLEDAHLEGAHLEGAALDGAHMERASLNGARLDRAHLFGANLQDAVLQEARLEKGHLVGTYLERANLSQAHLKGAYLSWAHLEGASLKGADLEGATLMETHLEDVYLDSAHLTDADFAGVIIGGTRFDDVDLSNVKRLYVLANRSPSTIGIDTLYKSKGNIPEDFLRGCGVPDTMIVFAKSLTRSAIEYYSCFISYSSADELFARRLHNDLQMNGVRVWFAPEDMKTGAKIRDTLDEAVRLYDKLIIILSKDSIKSDWVEKEIETAFEKERQLKKRHGKESAVLFPIRVDDTVMKTKQAWAADIRRVRHIADFRDWTNPLLYQNAINRLLRDLNAKT